MERNLRAKEEEGGEVKVKMEVMQQCVGDWIIDSLCNVCHFDCRAHMSNSRPGGQIQPTKELSLACRIIFNYC